MDERKVIKVKGKPEPEDWESKWWNFCRGYSTVCASKTPGTYEEHEDLISQMTARGWMATRRLDPSYSESSAKAYVCRAMASELLMHLRHNRTAKAQFWKRCVRIGDDWDFGEAGE